MKRHMLIAALVALVLAATAAEASALALPHFCIWDFCDQPGCWWICL